MTTVSVDGEVAWRGVSTYLARGLFLLGEGRRRPLGAVRAARRPTGRWALAADAGRRYAAVSGDRNPIHLSSLAAKAFGFPRAIAHGMYTASLALAAVGAARGDAFDWSVDVRQAGAAAVDGERAGRPGRPAASTSRPGAACRT